MGGIFVIIIIWVIISAVKSAITGPRNHTPVRPDPEIEAREAFEQTVITPRASLGNLSNGNLSNGNLPMQRTQQNSGNVNKAQTPASGGSSYYSVRDGKPIVQHSAEDCTGGSIHTDYHEGTPRRPMAASSYTKSTEGTLGNQGVRTSDMARQQGPSYYKENFPKERFSKDSSSRERSSKDSFSKERFSKERFSKERSFRDNLVPEASNAAQPVIQPIAAQENGAERLQNAIAAYPAAVQGLIWSEVLNRPMSNR